MAEKILPGTYIEVRDEGLISAGRIATGIVGVVGTADRGPLNEPVTLSSYSDAVEQFGPPDDFHKPSLSDYPLTLTRAIKLIFDNGATTVVAVRVGDPQKAVLATYQLVNDKGRPILNLTANTSGTAGNDIELKLETTSRAKQKVQEFTTQTGTLDPKPIDPSKIRFTRVSGRNGSSTEFRYISESDLEIKEEEVTPDDSENYSLKHPPAKVKSVRATRDYQLCEGTPASDVASGTNTESATEQDKPASPPDNQGSVLDTDTVCWTIGNKVLDFGLTPGDNEILLVQYVRQLEVDEYSVTADGKKYRIKEQLQTDAKLTATYIWEEEQIKYEFSTKETTESYLVSSINDLAESIQKGSKLFDQTKVDIKNPTGVATEFTLINKGADHAGAGASDYEKALSQLSEKLVNIVVLAGQDTSQGMGTALQSHLNMTENLDFERIGVIGAPTSASTDNPAALAAAAAHSQSSERMIVVFPGLKYWDANDKVERYLPSAYTAAAVAGKIASLPVHTSLTNKTITIPGLALDLKRGEQQDALKANLLTVVNKNGYRILKGITTAGESQPFAAISTRRIVDYAKYGVRSAANPYLGRLNNERVRAALQASLEGFLTRMVADEALTTFQLSVTATRPQEIAGVVSVAMTLQPTFSIDFIEVVMTLQ